MKKLQISNDLSMKIGLEYFATKWNYLQINNFAFKLMIFLELVDLFSVHHKTDCSAILAHQPLL